MTDHLNSNPSDDYAKHFSKNTQEKNPTLLLALSSRIQKFYHLLKYNERFHYLLGVVLLLCFGYGIKFIIHAVDPKIHDIEVSGKTILQNTYPGMDPVPIDLLITHSPIGTINIISEPEGLAEGEEPEDSLLLMKYIEIKEIKWEYGEYYINCRNGMLFSKENGGLLARNEDWAVSDTDSIGGVSLYDLYVDPLMNLPTGKKKSQLHINYTIHEKAGNEISRQSLDIGFNVTIFNSKNDVIDVFGTTFSTFVGALELFP